MPKNRQSQVCLDATPYYHCVSRCVRRAFLCGESEGRSFEHRRGWIERKLLLLSDIFAIDLCAYAVMSNHYHVVLHVDREQALAWDEHEVIERWHRLYKGNFLSQTYLSSPSSLGEAELAKLRESIESWRERLYSLSQFMAILNEGLARQANQEDQCTGRFWEGRFKSQALLDEEALAACMAYVDLNPVRAAIAATPESSDYTSAKLRAEKAQQVAQPNHFNQQVKQLMPFAGNPRKDMPKGMPFRLTDYLQLLDWTSRIVREDKRGYVPKDTPSIVERLNIDPKHFAYLAQNFESQFRGVVGTLEHLKQRAKRFGYRRIPVNKACIAIAH